MVSLTQWTWVWVNSGSWWWTGRAAMLQSMGSHRVGHFWPTQLNWSAYYLLLNWNLYFNTVQLISALFMISAFCDLKEHFTPWFHKYIICSRFLKNYCFGFRSITIQNWFLWYKLGFISFVRAAITRFHRLGTTHLQWAVLKRYLSSLPRNWAWVTWMKTRSPSH